MGSLKRRRGLMEVDPSVCSSVIIPSEGERDLRRGPWTVEEDLMLINYIANNGEGRWNSLARCAGLKRTGKSCRLRWLNYLRPDVRIGNITPEEQLLILELHSRWGNRWSKIAQHLPGRTDNEIKNYWRTRILKSAKQIQCDVNSAKFRAVVRFIWIPRLLEQIRAFSGSSPDSVHHRPPLSDRPTDGDVVKVEPISESLMTAAEPSSDSLGTPVSDCLADGGNKRWAEETLNSGGYANRGLPHSDEGQWRGDLYEDMWDLEDLCSV